jgi:RNA polymerase sigma-70 factor (ECF subfamily)
VGTIAPDKAGADRKDLEWQRRCVERAQAGDLSAMREVFARYADLLYGRVIVPRLGDPDEAQDVLKETFVTAMEKIDTFKWKGASLYGWLRTIAVNKVIDRHRKRGRFNRLTDELKAEVEKFGDRPAPPEEQLIEAEERRINQRRVREALEEVNPRYRRALELRLLEERSRQECAELLNVSVGTFDVLFYRAAAAFRKVFGEP